MDPMRTTNNAVDIKAPFEIVSERPLAAEVRSEIEFYFTVNGRPLSTSTNQNFHVAFTSIIEKLALDPLPRGHTAAVIGATATCNGAAMGYGAGYYALNITDPAAIEEFTSPTLIPASDGSLTGTGANRVLTFRFNGGGGTAPGELPNYHDGYDSNWHTETRDAGPGAVAVSMKAYDRASRTVKTIRRVFDGCILR